MELLVAPKSKQTLLQVHLPRPKDNQLQQFLWDEDGLELYEMVEHFDPHRSWFLDNQLAQRGHFRMLTKLDPLYLFLPHLQRLAGQKYRTLADICGTINEENKASSRLDFALGPDIDWGQVCDTKEVERELYVRFSESKTRSWLMGKHSQVVEALRKELGESEISAASLNSSAHELMSLYLEPNWSKSLKQSLK